MSNILLPGDPEFDKPISWGDAYKKTPKGSSLALAAEMDAKKEEQSQGHFKYASSMISHAPDPWFKLAQSAGVNNIMTQPMWFSPLYTAQNWQIASKRREVYTWNRFFVENEPKVAAAINFYSQFPMNGFDLECTNRKIREYYKHHVAKRLRLNEMFKMISFEYFSLGDVFIYMDVECPVCHGSSVDPETGEVCNHPNGSFKRLVVLNPDWIEVQQSVIASEPVIYMMPDEELKRIVFYKQPRAIYEKIPNSIKEKVIQNQPIPLSNRNTSHLKHMPCPYGTYGTSLTRRLFTTLAYKTKIMTANWIVAERLILPVRVVKVGTDERPATTADIADLQQQLSATANDPNLTIVTHHAFCHDMETEVLTDDGWKRYDELTKEEKIMNFDPATENMWYEKPIKYYEFDYSGDMIRLNGNKYDMLVTPNHRMLCYKRDHEKHGVISAEKFYQMGESDRYIRSAANYITKDMETIDFCGHSIPTDVFMRLVGWYISEGSTTYNEKKYQYKVSLSQSHVVNSAYCNEIDSIFNDIPIESHKYSYEDKTQWVICNKNIANQFKLWFGSNAYNKRIPNFIKNLPPHRLKILIDSYVKGDATFHNYSNSIGSQNGTVSRQLADDLLEIMFKCGFAPTISRFMKSKNQYVVNCNISGKGKGRFSRVKKSHISKENYSGKVWCVKTSSGFFVTRRNGRIAIQGNSYEWFGASGKILQVTQEMEYIGKEILDGFMLNQSLLNGEMCIPQYDRILTRNGFRSLSQISEDDEIATVNKETGYLEYQKPTAIHQYDWDGDLVHFQTDRIDFACTPNHRMLYQKRDHDEWIVETANKVRDRAKFRKSVNWYGCTEEISLDAEKDYWEFITKQHAYRIDGCQVPFNDMLKIIAYYVSEGHIQKETRKTRSTFGQPQSMQIAQTDKGKGWSDLCELRKDAEYKIAKTRHGFAIHNKQLAILLNEQCGHLSHNKRLPSWIKELSVYHLKMVLGYLINGDGSLRTRDKNGPKKYYSYFTKSIQLRDDVMEISLKCGYFPRFRKRRNIWEITFSDYDLGKEVITLESKKHQTITKLPYKGKVWCVTVPNGFIISERNGKLMISGNSGYQSAQVGVETLIRRIESWRHTLAEWCEERVFLPIAEMQGFIDHERSEELGEVCYLYPKIKWKDLQLKDKNQWYNTLLQLYQTQLISAQTLLEEMDLNYDQEVKRMRYEQVQSGPAGGAVGAGGAGPGMGMGGGGMGGLGDAGGGMGGAGGLGDMGGGMGGGMGAGGMAGGMGAGTGGDMGAGGMGPTAGAPMKITKKGKGNKPEEHENMPMAMVKLTGIEQKMANMLLDVVNNLKISQNNIRIQFPVQNPNGGKPFMLDFAIPKIKLDVEVDGEIFHSGDEQQKHDQERDFLLAQRGWTVLRFDDRTLEDSPQAVKQTVSQFIQKLLQGPTKKASLSQKHAHLFTTSNEKLINLVGDSAYEKYYSRFIKYTDSVE